MDSINQQQREENRKNLGGQEATKKIKELADSAQSCFFCTNIKTGQPFAVRPMSPQQIDDEGNLWFLSADDSMNLQRTHMCNFCFRAVLTATL